MMKKHLNTAMAVGAAILLAGCTMNSNTINHSASENFVSKVAMSDHFEMASSTLALKKSHNAQVRAFARSMIDDHAGSERELRNAVNSSSVDRNFVTDDLSGTYTDKLDMLRGKRGKDFDTAYIMAQRETHSDAVRLFRDYREHGSSKSLRQFAVDSLPTIEAHEQRIYKINP
ncbi:MAG: DUF4142 domain-containing protein [Micavibrio sp.]|nr:DUF4142 domain-containing protein [Micavibrio sp.]